MNKEEIKKALNYCKGNNNGIFNCKECPYHTKSKCNDTLCNDTLELITEQEKEIGKITEEINFWREVNNTALILTKEECDHKVIFNDNDLESLLKDVKKKTQKETAKEVTEKLKNYFEDKLVDEFGNITTDIDEIKGCIGELLKEYEK